MKDRVPKRGMRKANLVKKPGLMLMPRKKVCRFCRDKIKDINYKDSKLLEAFVKDRGTIVSVRYSGNCAKHQRQVIDAIKKARFLGLIYYVKR